MGRLANAAGQEASGPEDASCLRFAQTFYDWYVPWTQKRMDRPASDMALRYRPEVFNSDLLRALKIDSEASARANGEIVGLDFDPFVGGQDPADHYEARHGIWRNDRCFVEIWRNSPTDTAAKTTKPDAVAEIAFDHGHWKFLNFQYPQVNADLVSVLKQLAHDRQKH
jgi:hypothetical protein